jgi:hypothetical protein
MFLSKYFRMFNRSYSLINYSKSNPLKCTRFMSGIPLEQDKVPEQQNPHKSNKLLYNILELHEKCTQEEIKTKHHTLAKQYHPDNKEGNELKFIQIQKAYEILRNIKDRQEYDTMSQDKHKKFNDAWYLLYHDYKYKIKELDKIIENNNKKDIFSYLSKFHARILKSRYNSLMAYEQSKYHNNYEQSKCHNNKAETRHIYFLLDTSCLMYEFDRKDPILKNIPSIQLNCFWYLYRSDNSDKKHYHAMKKASYIYKCMENITSILKHLQYNKNNNLYVGSFMTLCDKNNIIKENEKLAHLSECLEATDVTTYERGTPKIFDSLALAINNVRKNGSISLTTFVLYTDGTRDNSRITFEELIALIKETKNVNIIIMAINLDDDDVKYLKEIIKAAKFGKLLQVGSKISDFGFANIDDAFTNAKDIIVKGDYIENCDIEKRFDLC